MCVVPELGLNLKVTNDYWLKKNITKNPAGLERLKPPSIMGTQHTSL